MRKIKLIRNPQSEPFLITGLAGVILLAFLFFRDIVFSSGQAKTQVNAIRAEQKIVKHDLPVPAGDSLRKAAPIDGVGDNTYTGLIPFFESLDKVMADKTILHIAYFGDSMIEGDFVTHPLRRRLQMRFGGNGIGFIPVTSPQPGFRRTILQNFNDDWKVYSFLKPGDQKELFPGLSGYVFETREGAEVSFKSEPGYGPFRHASILYGGKNTIRLNVLTDSVGKDISLVPEGVINDVPLAGDTLFSSVEIKVLSEEPGIIYGLNFESGPGVYVDNYAFRGNSGLPLTNIPDAVFAGFHKTLNNKLIIIHYGLNVFTPGVDDYHWYELAMDNVISYIKATSPGIPILIISMPDRAALISGEFATPAELPAFIRLQKRVAEKSNVAFFSLFDAMGGVNSMRNWVEGKTKLAADDYTHPNGSGASRIADYIYQYLMTGYEQFKHPNDTIPVAQVTKSI